MKFEGKNYMHVAFLNWIESISVVVLFYTLI